MSKDSKEQVKKKVPKSRQPVRAKPVPVALPALRPECLDQRISEKQLFHNGSNHQQPQNGSKRSLEQEIAEKQQGRRTKNTSGLGQKPGAFPVSNHKTVDQGPNPHLELVEFKIAAMTRFTTSTTMSSQDSQKALKNTQSSELRDVQKHLTSMRNAQENIARGATPFEALEAHIAAKIREIKRAPHSNVDSDGFCTASKKKIPAEILKDTKGAENRDGCKEEEEGVVAATTTPRNSESTLPRRVTSAEALEARAAKKIRKTEKKSLESMRLHELEERVEAKRRAVGVSKMPPFSDQKGKHSMMKASNDPKHIKHIAVGPIKTTENEAKFTAKKIPRNMVIKAPIEIERLEQQLRAKKRLLATRRIPTICYTNKASSTSIAQNRFTTRIRRLERQLCAKERIFAGDGSRLQPARDRSTTISAHWSAFLGHEHFNEIENQITCKSLEDSEDIEHLAVDRTDEPPDCHIGRIIDCSADLEEGVTEDPELCDVPLAVALPVEQEPVESFIPSAEHYDPEEKTAFYRNRRFRMYGFLVTFIFALLAIGILTGVSLTTTEDKQGSAQYIRYREKLGIREAIEQIVGSEVLNNDSSPYEKALQWITYHDPQDLTPDAPNFIQRYVLAYLYFSTSGNKGWNFCNPPNQEGQFSCVWNQLQYLSHLKRLQVTGIRWLSLQPECFWAGISCDQFGQVRRIDLAGFDLTGSFPVGIVHLPFLQSISMNSNKLTGPLPREVNSLKYLINIELQNNEFTGRIPQEWFDLRNLQNFNVGGNEVVGRISSRFQKLSDLKFVYLHDNMMTGVIPTELGDLSSLSFIRLDHNVLKGTIPTELGNANTLTGVFLHDNNLSGTIPSELGASQYFNTFRVENNGRLSGEIPDSILPRLEEFSAFNCNLKGNLTGKFLLMKNMKSLKLHNNYFTGNLPSNLGETMPLIQELWISGNQFTGTVPDSICDLRGPFLLAELVADCAPSSTGIPDIFCPKNCCTQCCSSGRNCLATSYSN